MEISIKTDQAINEYLGCLNNKLLRGINILSVRNDFSFSFLIVASFLYIENAEIIAGTKKTDSNRANRVPNAVNIPKSFTIVI